MPDRCEHTEPERAGAAERAELGSYRGALGLRALQGDHCSFRLRRSRFGCRTDCQPVGANSLPFLDQHSVRLEETANAVAFPAGDLFENRSEHGQALVLSTVRFAICETSADSETAMVSPSRELMYSMTWISELPS